jgi:hypothetical protein
MSKRKTVLCGGLVAITFIFGCGIGYNRVLFVTKTNVGFEVDTKPPSLQLSIGRLEGVFAPQFERGQKPPVLASFRFENDGVFSPFVGSAFATGDAALTLAALYGEQTPSGDWQSRLNTVNGKDPNRTVDSAITIEKTPKLTSWLSTLLGESDFQEDDVRPIFFGTDTSLGLKIAWSGTSSYVPDTARFGYARKELAWVPLTLQHTSDNKYKVKMSPLLATLDSGFRNITLDDNQPAGDFSYVQYFASGDAATLLAMQQDVRQAMLLRLDPHAKDLALRFRTGLTGPARVQQLLLMAQVQDALAKLTSDKKDPEAKQLLDELDKIGRRLPKTYVRYLNWNPNASPPEITFDPNVLATPDFNGVRTYWGDLKLTTENLQIVADQLKADPNFIFKIRPVLNSSSAKIPDATPQEKAQLLIHYKEAAESFSKLDEQLQRDPAIIAAVTHFTKTILASE